MNKFDPLFSSNSDEWYTPIDLFNNLNNEFHFTLDPCATDEWHLCDKYFTKDSDGLFQSWSNEIVFCNPPYSQISEWVYKCFLENQQNNITIVLLIPARTDTKYFHNYILPFCELRFIKGRLKFSNKGTAPFPSILCIYHSR